MNVSVLIGRKLLILNNIIYLDYCIIFMLLANHRFVFKFMMGIYHCSAVFKPLEECFLYQFCLSHIGRSEI